MKAGQFSKALVTLVILLNVVFTLIILVVFYKTGNEPSTLITAWFSFTGIELLSLATIKIQKARGKKHGRGTEDCGNTEGETVVSEE